MTMRSKIEPMKKVARQMRKHRPLIMNWFEAKGQFSSGIVEGFNNKAKLTMRKSYGFKTFKAIEIALYHALGDLPEPQSTHRFFRVFRGINGLKEVDVVISCCARLIRVHPAQIFDMVEVRTTTNQRKGPECNSRLS